MPAELAEQTVTGSHSNVGVTCKPGMNGLNGFLIKYDLLYIINNLRFTEE